MITEERVLDVVSTLEGEKVAMSIDDDALAHIMSVLTELYSDQELAVIREYSTNALDSHVEAGVTRPIEITTPSALSPYFKVKDYGIGMDIEDIRNIYSRYGASTKRESDEFVGMLGLGCKSALAYTDQFTLSAVKNGKATQVSISRDENGAGSMTIVAEYETDEPNGVEITVPAKSYNHFDSKAQKFFRFWDEGTVLVNGVAPQRIDGFWVSENLLLTKETDNDVVVMGNVAYPMNEYSYGAWKTVAFVEIGAVTFTPSREALQMTPKTKNRIEAIKKEVEEKKIAAIQKQINEAPDRLTALKLFVDSASLGFRGTATYQGKDIPSSFDAPMDEKFTVVKAHKGWGDRGYSDERAIPMNIAVNSYWLVGFPKDESFSPYKRKKLNQWQAKQSFDVPKNYILVDKLPNSPWIDKTHVKNWSEIAAEKIVREGTVGKSGKIAGSYKDVVVDGTIKSEVAASEIDITKPIYWRRRDRFYHETLTFLKNKHPKGYTLVTLPNNRIAKFQRDFPKAIEIDITWHRNIAKKWFDGLSKEAKLAFELKVNNVDWLRWLDEFQIDDPELALLVTAAKERKHDKHYQDWRESYRNFLNVNFSDGYQKILNQYPLLTAQRIYGKIDPKTEDHYYMYINAVYDVGGNYLIKEEVSN